MSKVRLLDRPRIEVDDTHPPDMYAKAFSIAKMVAEELHDQYPHHPWRVYVCSDNSTITVMNDLISQFYGYHLHVRNLGSASEIKSQVRWAGGEFLERFRISRTRGTEKDYADQQPTWLRGKAVTT